MIDLILRLRNPFKCKDFRNIRCWNWNLTKNKSFEVQFSHYTFDWLELRLYLNWRQMDHAGPWMTVNLFGWTLDLRMYDRRHWDYDNNDWKQYGTHQD